MDLSNFSGSEGFAEGNGAEDEAGEHQDGQGPVNA